MTDSYEKLEEIKKVLNKDLMAADIKLSIFISAAISYKQDSLLSPFPKSYLDKNGVKDFEKLTEDLQKIPGLEEFLILLMSDNASIVLPDAVVNLLHWILTTPKYTVDSVPKNKFEDVLALSKMTGKSAKPTQIFKINYIDSGLELKFLQLKKCLDFETKFSFHGTKFYNAYPIINYGLQQHLNKTGLFGEGLYFSQELGEKTSRILELPETQLSIFIADVSLLFSPAVLGWDKSNCGNVITCVMVCEYINDPLHVKVRKENAKNSDIPQSYILITNNELVRPRYLLIYGSKKSISTKQAEKTTQVVEQRQSFLTWFRKNPMIVSVVLYVMLLSLVGLSKNRAVEYYKNIIVQFLKNRFKFV